MNKVIIDVRGNPGGDSRTCEKLLKILGMKVPEYSMYLRYSPKAAAQNGYKKTSGHYYHKGSVKKAKKNPKIIDLGLIGIASSRKHAPVI